MSRAALWRQESNVRERERHANETFENALQEGRSRPQKGLIPVKDDRTFNLNPMLLQNISKSPYFIKSCSKIKDWTSLVDEIYYEVKHAEPWTQGHTKTPSTAFCLLLRLLCLRCTEKQMKLMLDHVDSPYIRVIGFLYLRFAADPAIIWKWFQPYLYDEEMVKIEMNVKRPEITMGEFVRGLLTDLEYFRTRLPRLPVTIERDIKMKMMEEEKIEERALKHLKDSEKMKYFEKIGSRVQAMYGDEENPITWYDAVVDRVIKVDDASGVELFRPKFVVTFPEYGNTETVTVGEMDMPGVDHSQSRAPSSSSSHRDTERRDMGRGHDHRRDYNRYDRERRYDDRERGYDRNRESSHDRSHGYRGHRHGSRGYDEGRGDRIYDRDGHDYRRRERSRSRDRAHPVESRDKSRTSGNPYASAVESLKSAYGSAANNSSSHQRDEGVINRYADSSSQSNVDYEQESKQPVKKTPEQLAAISEKKRKLLAKYG